MGAKKAKNIGDKKLVSEVDLLKKAENMIKTTKGVKILSGRSNPALAKKIVEYLKMDITPTIIKNFSDGEIYVQVEDSIRGDDVFIIQPICNPVNENLMELLIMLDACKRASAKEVTAVIPYYGYARQDRKTAGREAITAKLVADLITTAGADRVVAMDLHTGQIQGYFNIVMDHIFSMPVLAKYMREKGFSLDDMVAVSPDAGGVERTRRFAKKLYDCPIAIIDKRRTAHNVAEVGYVIGDVKDKIAILFDDMIDTAGTITKGAELLMEQGAKEVYVCAAHGVFSGPALERLDKSCIKEVVITNTIPLKEDAPKKIVQLDIAPLLGEAIIRIHNNQSVSSIFE